MSVLTLYRFADAVDVGQVGIPPGNTPEVGLHGRVVVELKLQVPIATRGEGQ